MTGGFEYRPRKLYSNRGPSPLPTSPSMIERDGYKQAESRDHLTSTSWCLHDTVEGDVQPGRLLGPITGLSFSRDGGLLFSCSGSCLTVFDVRSGALLHTARVLPPGLAVYGLDIGHKSRKSFSSG